MEKTLELDQDINDETRYLNDTLQAGWSEIEMANE
jgi:hypothetical protein